MNNTQLHDVFLIHHPLDAGLAFLVEKNLQDAGLRVYAATRMFDDEAQLDGMRHEMIACPAILFLLTPSNLNTQGVAYVAGASSAWHSTLFCLYNGIEDSKLPTILHGFECYPVSEIETVVDGIRDMQPIFSPTQQDALTQICNGSRRAVDDLIADRNELESVTAEFNDATHSRLNAKRIAQELMRIHKTGRLTTVNGASAGIQPKS